VPTFFKYFQNISLSQVKFSGGEMDNITITLHEPESPTEDVNFYLNPTRNSITMNVTKLFAQLEGDFVYRLFMMDVTGRAYVNMSDMSFDVEVNLTTQDGLKTGQLAPALKILNIDVNVDPDDIKIHLEGGLVSKIAELFTEVFKKEILSKVITDTEKEIE